MVPAHTGQLAEVVVEGPVLLHEDHHVLQIGYVALVALGQVVFGRARLRAADRFGDRPGGEGAEGDGGGLEHPAPGDPEFAGGTHGALGVGAHGFGDAGSHQGDLWGRVIQGGERRRMPAKTRPPGRTPGEPGTYS